MNAVAERSLRGRKDVRRNSNLESVDATGARSVRNELVLVRRSRDHRNRSVPRSSSP
jgi:hypothetical protein